MNGRLRQLSEPRLRQEAEIEKSQTPVERDILVQCVRNIILVSMKQLPLLPLTLGSLVAFTDWQCVSRP